LLFKAHKSNYAISGFTQEASVKELAALAHSRNLPMMYDIGSGLLRKPKGLPLENEPDVRTSVAEGADLVSFSCDKLLGGPQAGIVAGGAEYVRRLATAPMMRALRVGKLTLAALSAACRAYLTDKVLTEDNPTFAMLSESTPRIGERAKELAEKLKRGGIACGVVDNQARVGGGTLPELTLPSKAVHLETPKGAEKDGSAEDLFYGLLKLDTPVVSILREGRVLLDVLTVRDEELSAIAEAVRRTRG
jgi:L-seryl-tRNA(Ser) seleniumtransferase